MRFLLELRLKYDILLASDCNGWTASGAGWDGTEAVWTDVPFLQGRRVSECSRSLGARGAALVRGLFGIFSRWDFFRYDMVGL